MKHLPSAWLTEQAQRQRALFLMLDRHAEADLPAPLPAAAVQARLNLYQDSEAAPLAGLGPWLIEVADPHADWLHAWLEQPEHHWGWLASTARPDLPALLRHWRARILIHEQGRRVLYRFQDNRVIARHLAALEPAQRPRLLGPFDRCLAWDGQCWQTFDNPAPGSHPVGDAPWLNMPEPAAIAAAIRRHNLEEWLWQNHCAALCRLLHEQPLDAWLDQQLALADAWRWQGDDALKFLLAHRLHPERAAHAVWLPRDRDDPASHLARCRDFFSRLEATA